MLEISLNSIKANLYLVKMHMRETAAKPITVVDYVSCNELMCTAQYCICQKKNFQSSFEAFVILLNYELPLLEGLNLTNSSIEWLLRIIEIFCFRELSEIDIKKEIVPIIEDIKEIIAEKNIDPAKKEEHLNRLGINGYPNHWGIYINKELVPLDGFKLPVADEILSGIGLRLEWDDRRIFYETTNEYVLFNWSTSA